MSLNKKIPDKEEKKVLKALETVLLHGNSEQREAVRPLLIKAAKGPHPSHKTRMSDASTFDEICENCGATDGVFGGWGNLALPCPTPDGKPRRSC